MQTTMLEAPISDDNTDPCNNLSMLTTMQTTMLEAPTTVIVLTTAPTTAH